MKHLSKQDEGSSSKLKAFYEKLAEHEKLSEENSILDNNNIGGHQQSKKRAAGILESKDAVDFNPDEQDEENYQF